jgi:hypothetical protein
VSNNGMAGTCATFALSADGRLERLCFVDEHDRNIIMDGVSKFARGAVERRIALAILERALAARADENFEKAWSEGHVGISV